MAIIKHMLGDKVIAGFRGTLDFYYYMGIPVCRSWPSSPGSNRAPAVQAGWPAFSYASREWNNLSASVRRTYEELSSDSGLSARDTFQRGYMAGLYRNPLP